MRMAMCVGVVLSVVVSMLCGDAMAFVALMGKDVSMTFDDVEASFAPAVRKTGEHGSLYLADPLDACSHVMDAVSHGPNPPFALVVRGGCTFDEKVRNAQKAGFMATIVYDNEDTGPLIPMSGNPSGIKIPSVFVSKASGEVMMEYAGVPGIDIWILPDIDNSPSSVVSISLLFIVAICAVVITYCFVRSLYIRRRRPISQATESRESQGMSSQLVHAMPSIVFTKVVDECCTSMTCAFCLDDYVVGDKLRVLPCQHKFHASCVDSWLTAWRTFCPMCKQDVRTSIRKPPASERTPLLSPAYPVPAAALRSFHSSIASSPAIEIPYSSHHSSLTSRTITPSPSRSLAASRNHSISSMPRTLTLLRSYNNSPAANINRSLADGWNLSSQRSHVSYLMSSHSLGQGVPSSMNSRFASPYNNCSGNGPSSYLVGSSSRQSYLRHNESATSLSTLGSAYSLPRN